MTDGPHTLINASPASFYDPVEMRLSTDPIVIPSTARPRIPDGTYVAKLIGHRTSIFRAGAKLELIFELQEVTSNRGCSGCFGMFFPVARLIGPEGMNGKFIPKGRRSKLAQFVSTCSEELGNSDPLSLSLLGSLWWIVDIKCPSQDFKGKPIPERDRYSIVVEARPRRAS